MHIYTDTHTCLLCITFAACCSASQSCSICLARAVKAKADERREQHQQLLFTARHNGASAAALVQVVK